MTQEWTRVATRSELSDGIHLFRVSNESIVIGAFGESVVAFSAFCPHMRGPMVHSEIEGFVVSCPLHGWRFDLNDAGRELHGYRNLRMYPVKVDGDEILVALN